MEKFQAFWRLFRFKWYQTKLEPRPVFAPLGLKFKFSNDYPRPSHEGVPTGILRKVFPPIARAKVLCGWFDVGPYLSL